MKAFDGQFDSPLQHVAFRLGQQRHMALREPGAIGICQATQQADRRAFRPDQRIEIFADRGCGFADDGCCDFVIVVRMVEDHRRVAREILGLGDMGEFDELLRIVSELGHDPLGQGRTRPYPVISEKRPFQQVAAEAGAACLVADDEAPAADAADRAVAPRIVDGAGAKGADDAVGIAECALQRDQGIGHDLAITKGKGLFDAAAVVADIGACDADDGGDAGNGFRRQCGIAQCFFRGENDVFQGTLEIGQDIGGARRAAAQNLAAPVCDRGAAA